MNISDSFNNSVQLFSNKLVKKGLPLFVALACLYQASKNSWDEYTLANIRQMVETLSPHLEIGLIFYRTYAIRNLQKEKGSLKKQMRRVKFVLKDKGKEVLHQMSEQQKMLTFDIYGESINLLSSVKLLFPLEKNFIKSYASLGYHALNFAKEVTAEENGKGTSWKSKISKGLNITTNALCSCASIYTLGKIIGFTHESSSGETVLQLATASLTLQFALAITVKAKKTLGF